MTLRPVLLAILLAAGALPAANVAVNLSGTTNQPFANKLVDTDVQVARFVLQASGGDVIIDGVTIDFSNPTNAALAFSGVRLFYDANGNGTFEDPAEELGSVQAVGTGSVTFTETFTSLNGLIRELQVRVHIGNNVAVYGEAFQARIDAAASIILPGASSDTVSGTFPATGNAITIRNSVNQLVQGTGNPATPRTVAKGSQSVSGVHFIIDCQVATNPGELVGIDLQGIAISVTTQTAGQTAAVSGVSLWQDDGDGLFEPGAGEIQILGRTPADVGKWIAAGNVITVTFDGTSIAVLPQINTGQARAFWASISFVGGMECVCQVSVNRTGIQGSLGNLADFFVTNPASIQGEVITVADVPKGDKAPEASGEGGCSTSGEPLSGLSLAWLLAGIASGLWLRKRKVKQATCSD